MNHINLKSEKLFKFLKDSKVFFIHVILPILAGVFLFFLSIAGIASLQSLGFKKGKIAGIKEIKELYQKELIGRNLAVYDELTGQWTMLGPDQIVNNLIKHKKININSFTPIGVSGIRECNCNSSKNTNNDELFDLESIENFDINKTALNKSKNKSPKISKK